MCSGMVIKVGKLSVAKTRIEALIDQGEVEKKGAL